MVKAENIMRKNAVTMEKKKGFKGALDIMLNTKTDYVVVTEKGRPAGIITERDVLKKLVSSIKKIPNPKIEKCMKELISIRKSSDIEYISELMQEEDIRHLPVVEHNRLLGMVTSSDIIRETGELQVKNVEFTRWQNIQTAIIIIFFAFLLAYVLISLL
ncbi:MAG: cyclic nucleotide-binding/CBS domain-containing protein [Candidatus Nanoarchaeia archaeon]